MLPVDSSRSHARASRVVSLLLAAFIIASIAVVTLLGVVGSAFALVALAIPGSAAQALPARSLLGPVPRARRVSLRPPAPPGTVFAAVMGSETTSAASLVS